MAIPSIPSIKTIKDRMVTDIESKINDTVTALPLSFVKILCGAIAGAIFLNYQAILWVYKQIFPQSADYASLVLLGAIVGITLKEAVPAIILCDVPGTGAQVDVDEAFSSSNGFTYRVTTATPIVGGVASDVPMKAININGEGEASNLADGEELSIVSTNIDLDGTATVTGTQTDGSDVESRASFSARVTFRYRTRYITGSPGAYAINGLEAPNFISILPYQDEELPNNINVYGKVDNQPDGIPTQTQLDNMYNYLLYIDGDDSGQILLKPIGDIPIPLPISRKLFDIQVFIDTADTDIQLDVANALNDYIDTLAPYCEGVTVVVNDVLTNTQSSCSADGAAKQNDAKVTDATITDVDSGVPLTTGGYKFYGGEHGKFRNITFTVVS